MQAFQCVLADRAELAFVNVSEQAVLEIGVAQWPA